MEQILLRVRSSKIVSPFQNLINRSIVHLTSTGGLSSTNTAKNQQATSCKSHNCCERFQNQNYIFTLNQFTKDFNTSSMSMMSSYDQSNSDNVTPVLDVNDEP